MIRYKSLFTEGEDMVVKEPEKEVVEPKTEEEINEPAMELKQQTQDAVVENPIVEEDEDDMKDVNFDEYMDDEIEVEDENNEENYDFDMEGEELDGEEEIFNFEDEDEIVEEVGKEEEFPIIGFSESDEEEKIDAVEKEEEKPVEIKESIKRYKSIFTK